MYSLVILTPFFFNSEETLNLVWTQNCLLALRTTITNWNTLKYPAVAELVKNIYSQDQEIRQHYEYSECIATHINDNSTIAHSLVVNFLQQNSNEITTNNQQQPSQVIGYKLN